MNRNRKDNNYGSAVNSPTGLRPPNPAALNPDLDELVRLVGEALPDSLRRRRRVLRGLISRLPLHYHFRDDIAALLVTLELHELSQRELPLSLYRSAASTRRPLVAADVRRWTSAAVVEKSASPRRRLQREAIFQPHSIKPN